MFVGFGGRETPQDRGREQAVENCQERELHGQVGLWGWLGLGGDSDQATEVHAAHTKIRPEE